MAQGLTLQQLEAMGAKPVTPTAPTSTPTKGISLQELQAMGAKPVNPVAPPEASTGRKVAETVAPSSTALFDYTRASSRLKSGEIANMQKEREALVKSKDPTARARISEIDADVADVTAKADKTFGQKAGMALGTGLELSGAVELGALGVDAGRYGIRKFLGKSAAEVAPKAVYTPFAGNKAVQAITKATTIVPKTATEEAAYISSSLGSKVKTIAKDTAKILPEGLSFGYGYDVASGLQDKEGGEAFKPGTMTALGAAIPVGIGGIRVAKNAITPSVSKSINSLEQTYADLMSGTTPGKKKISKLEQKTEIVNKAGTSGKTPMRTLAEQGIIPRRSGTKLDTFEQAQEYRNNISHLKDANKEALKEVGLSSQLSRLDDLEGASIQYANSQKNIDSGRAPKMIKEIRVEFAHLRDSYPDGVIPIGKVDEIKSARWDNVFGNKGLVDADVLKKDSEYAIAKAMQKHIEEVAHVAGNPEVAQLNREIGDRLEAAKFLEELNGKTIKGGRLLKYVSTAIGSTVGQTLPGKIIGAISGNLVGEIIISRNVAGPIKRIMLRNLETKDPASYTKTIEWLRKQKLDKETRLLLPAPRYIPMGGKDTQGRIITPEGKRLTSLPQSKSPTSAQTMNAINNPSIISRSLPPKKNLSNGQAFAGAPAGMTQDEEGNTTFDPKMAALGMLGAGISGRKYKRDTIGKFENKFKLQSPVPKVAKVALSSLSRDVQNSTKSLNDIWDDNQEAFNYLSKVKAFSTEGGLRAGDISKVKKSLENLVRANQKAVTKENLINNDSAAADILNRKVAANSSTWKKANKTYLPKNNK